MTKRMMVAAWSLLFCASAAWAQGGTPGTPSGETPGLPPVRVVEPVPVNAAPAPGSGDPAFWADGDALFSWFRGVTLPPLITTSPVGTAVGDAGILGKPGTRVLFGGNQFEDSLRIGFRAAAGYWFGGERNFGIEAGVMILGNQSTSFATSSSAFPILARPYTDGTTFLPQAVLVSYPGLSTDSVGAQSASGHLYSGNIDLDAKLVDEGWFRLIGMAGYRYFRYDESLGIQQTILPTSALFVPGTQINVTDRFATRNMFNGLDVGFKPQFVWQAWTLDLLLRASIGNTHHSVDIAGQQVVNVPGFTPVTQTGGLYALTTNIGHHTSNDWSVNPEVGAGLSWRVTRNFKVRVGYSLLYLNGMARAADQVNTVVNPLHLPGLPAAGAPAQPTFFLNRTDIWIQNLNAGLEFSF